jgi:hypothetical protein
MQKINYEENRSRGKINDTINTLRESNQASNTNYKHLFIEPV